MRDILGRAGNKSGVRRQLAAAHIVHVANVQLQKCLSQKQRNDASVAAYARGTLTIHVKNGIVCEHLKRHEEDFFAQLNDVMPGHDIKSFRYRIMRKSHL